MDIAWQSDPPKAKAVIVEIGPFIARGMQRVYGYLEGQKAKALHEVLVPMQ
jgi:hypothetical protein